MGLGDTRQNICLLQGFGSKVHYTYKISCVTVHEKIDHNAAKIVFSYGPKQPGYAHTLVSSFIA